MDQELTIGEILEYPIDANGNLVTRRSGLARMKPKLNAPPATQPGSVDWTMTTLFGTKERAVAMIESLVAGQGENADEKWVEFVLLYKKWQLQHAKGELPSPPTFNQVCHSLDFDATTFIRELQNGITTLMKSLGHMRMALASSKVLQNLEERASSPEASTKDIELALKIGGIVEDGGGMSVNINNTNTQQTAVMLKSDKEKQKSPLLQFQTTVTKIDEEVRKEDDI